MSEETKREKFKINIEPEEFNAIGSFKLTTSSDLGKLAYQVFSSAFEDFEGLLFEPGNANQEPTYSLIFNHGNYGEDAIVGVKSAVDANSNAGTNPLDRVRRVDNMYRYGSKYLATQDLIDVVEPLLTRSLYNNGNIKWGAIVSEHAERSQYNLYNPNAITQFTKVIGISAKKLVSLIYGYNVDGDKYDYTVNVLGAVNNGMIMGNSNINYVLQINRASENEVVQLYKAYGYNPTASNIIKC